ncbi:MAG: DUF192 domain-containing protein [Gemmatimonadetes bacterium]|nr:DUF192 domain-containing protein [Gemmatimonadota bacterium]
MTNRALRALGAVPLLALGACHGDSPSDCCVAPPVTANTVTLNGAKLTVAIASTNAARSQGLMGVTKLAADSGMLFVFQYSSNREFWMKNTSVPLSIAFLDSTKKVVFMADMAPNDSIARYGGLNAPRMLYAIEVNQGWFASHSVTVGTIASFTLPTTIVIEPDA